MSLEIEAGELFGLLGPNGAGKTTLISMLSTIMPPSSGHASVCGHDVMRRHADVRRCIGIVFQDPSLDDELTGEENLDFHGRLYGMDAARRKPKIREVMNLVDLSDRSRDLVKTYSGGMKRRLEIARGLMHTPRVLFLDEPTLGLDPQTRRKIWNYIKNLKDQYGMTIILTTHYMDEADQLCSRIAIMDNGKIAALDSPENLKAHLGGDILELATVTRSETFEKILKNLNGVTKFTSEDNRIELRVEHGESFIPRVFAQAQKLGVEISSVIVRKPNLEDVFIQLTGREMRDEVVKGPMDRIKIFMTRRRR